MTLAKFKYLAFFFAMLYVKKNKISIVMIKNKTKFSKYKSFKTNHNSNKKIWLYGYHSVIAAIENINRKKYRLVCTKNALNKLSNNVKKLTIDTSVIDTKDFYNFVNESAVHQGLALEVDPLKRGDMSDIFFEQTDNDIIIILDRIKDPQNVGAIIRSAEILGCRAIIGSTYHCAQESGGLVKAASGAFERLPYYCVTNISNILQTLRENGFLIIGLDHSGNVSIADLLKNLKKQPIACILGSEEKGMRYLTKQKCDHLIKINTYSNFNILNVSNAAAITLFAIREFL